jgi:rubrerythrin
MTNDELLGMARELLAELQNFVESDGDTSYLSTDEKEAEHHIKRARALISRAEAALSPGPCGLTGESPQSALWVCNACGHRTNTLDENGVSDECAYCPSCGSDDVTYLGADR